MESVTRENRHLAVEQQNIPAPGIDKIKTYPKIKKTKDGVTPDVDSPEEIPAWMNILKESFGTQSDELATTLLSQILSASGKDQTSMNSAAALIADLAESSDTTEALLASQMIACHFNSMRMLSKAQSLSDISNQERYLNMAIKLQRTFVAQIDALKRYRSKGQKIIVERVDISGGQAIIGSVQHSGGGTQ